MTHKSSAPAKIQVWLGCLGVVNFKLTSWSIGERSHQPSALPQPGDELQQQTASLMKLVGVHTVTQWAGVGLEKRIHTTQLAVSVPP
jgi:hypothetical protein